MGIDDRIKEVATAENARAYLLTAEKFIFCIDLLEISAHHPLADQWVNELEDWFDQLNMERTFAAIEVEGEITTGAVIKGVAAVGETVTVALSDENGMPIKQTGVVIEVLT